MDDSDIRSIGVIKEELSDIDELIRDNKILIDQYPDDLGLLLNFDSLNYRQKRLLKELSAAYEIQHLEAFDLLLNGAYIGGSTIPMEILGKFLTNFQDLITALVQKTCNAINSRGPIPIKIREWSQLNVSATSAGSLRIIVSGNPAIEQPHSIQALKSLNRLIDCEDDMNSLKEVSDDVGLRIMAKYKNLIHTLQSNSLEITFYDMFGSSSKHSRRKLTKEQVNRIYRIVRNAEERPLETIQLTGIFSGIKYHSNHFWFITDEKREITGKYNERLKFFFRRPNFEERCVCTFKHKVSYNEVNDEETETWELEYVDTPLSKDKSDRKESQVTLW
jgi:hypothetical protein